MKTAIEITELSKRFGDQTVLNGLNFKIQKKENKKTKSCKNQAKQL